MTKKTGALWKSAKQKATWGGPNENHADDPSDDADVNETGDGMNETGDGDSATANADAPAPLLNETSSSAYSALNVSDVNRASMDFFLYPDATRRSGDPNNV